MSQVLNSFPIVDIGNKPNKKVSKPHASNKQAYIHLIA